jgi:hypothetical protein
MGEETRAEMLRVLVDLLPQDKRVVRMRCTSCRKGFTYGPLLLPADADDVAAALRFCSDCGGKMVRVRKGKK